MNFLTSLILFSTLTLVGCSSNSITDYPRFSDQVKKSLSVQENGKDENLYEIPDMSNVPNNVAPGFSFTISHPNDSKLSGVFRSDYLGNLQLPYNVIINIKNKSFNEVKDLVSASYRKFFQRGSEGITFSIAKKEYWIEVRGLVKKPGRYLVKPTDSLDLVVDQAGGIQGEISQDYFQANIKSLDFDYKVLLNKYFESNGAEGKIKWLGGDSIFISRIDSIANKSQEIPFVTVLGGVTKPGKILFQKDASLYYFIDKSGGTLPGLGYEESYVFRNTKDGVKKIQFSFDEPNTIPAIFPNDTIYMNTQIKTPTEKVIERISQVASIISTIALVIIAL